eukprot:TRINITY_DN5394_c0_g3_i1.p3 TRINITY_DN5394_c0_g3~~TRINITY_DN5394_c0_g3_i1.p3  ORF type:complete len:126 (+),score=16.89 TRINITY_DN5394_c0_g3_i1:329-706(+)
MVLTLLGDRIISFNAFNASCGDEKRRICEASCGEDCCSSTLFILLPNAFGTLRRRFDSAWFGPYGLGIFPHVLGSATPSGTFAHEDDDGIADDEGNAYRARICGKRKEETLSLCTSFAHGLGPPE